MIEFKYLNNVQFDLVSAVTVIAKVVKSGLGNFQVPIFILVHKSSSF